jgi:hypothetical protein
MSAEEGGESVVTTGRRTDPSLILLELVSL